MEAAYADKVYRIFIKKHPLNNRATFAIYLLT